MHFSILCQNARDIPSTPELENNQSSYKIFIYSDRFRKRRKLFNFILLNVSLCHARRKDFRHYLG